MEINNNNEKPDRKLLTLEQKKERIFEAVFRNQPNKLRDLLRNFETYFKEENPADEFDENSIFLSKRQKLLQIPEVVNWKNVLAHNCTPLHVASLFGFVEIVEILLATGADVFATDRYQCTPIHNAAFSGHSHCLKLLLSKVPTGSSILNNAMSVIAEASDKGLELFGNWNDTRTEALKSMRPKLTLLPTIGRAEFNMQDRTEHALVSLDRMEVMNESRSFQSARVNIGVWSGKWYYEVELLSAGLFQIGWATRECEFMPQSEEGVGDTPHSYAYDGSRCCKWHKEISWPYGENWKRGDIVGCLLDLDNKTISFSLNGKDLGIAFSNVKERGLYPALSMDKFQWARFYLGGKPLRFIPNGYSSIQEAADKQVVVWLDMLNRTKMIPELTEDWKFLQCEYISKLAHSLPIINCSPLNLAAYCGHTSCVEILLANETNPNLCFGFDGRSALMDAVFNGHTDIVKLLINHKANVDAVDNHIRSALHHCAFKDKSECAKILIEQGRANFEVSDRDGMRAVHFASIFGAVNTLQILIENGANLRLADAKGWDPLILAASNSQLAILAILLSHFSDTHRPSSFFAVTQEGRSALQYAAQTGDFQCVKLLIEKGADVNLTDTFGSTALSSAVFNNFYTVAEYLIQKGANVQSKNNYGKTALHKASMRGSTKCIELLLDKNADLMAVDQRGLTALHECAASGSLEAVSFLLNRGIEVNIKDGKGSTPLQTAIAMGRVEVASVLMEHGAELDFSLTWYKPTVKGNGPAPRYGHSMTKVGDRVFIYGGYCATKVSPQLFELNLITMSWTEIKVKGDPLKDRGDHVSIGYENKLFVFGGKTSTTNVLADNIVVIDTETYECKTLTVPFRRIGFSATLKDNKIYILGGVDERSHVVDECSIFDPEKMQFVASIKGESLGICFHHTFVHDNKVIVFGGTDSKGEYQYMSYLDEENQKLNNFETKNKITLRTSCTLLHAGHYVFVMGGIGKSTRSHPSEDQVIEGLNLLDLSTLTWTSLKSYLGPIQRFDTTAFFHKGDIWAFGGCDHKYMYGDVHCLHLEVELNSLAKDIRSIFNTDKFSDIAFVVQGRYLHAHRIVLWTRGERFRKLLTSEWVSENEINLSSDITYDSFYLFLEFIYTGEILTIHNIKPTPELSSSLIKLCHMFAPNLTSQLVQSATRIYFNRESTTYLEDFANAFDTKEFQDCTFMLGDQEVKAHRAIVCTRCPYLRALLLSGMRESTEKTPQIHDVSYSVFVALIKFLYSNKIDLTPELPPNTMPFWLQHATDDLSTNLLHKMTLTHIELHLDFNFVQELLAAANLYMVEGLKSDCSQQLAKLVEMRLVEPDDLLPLAQLFDLEDLISICKKYANEMDVS